MSVQQFGRSTGGMVTVAAAGSSLATGGACTGAINVVTGADDTKGVVLPAGYVAGEQVVVVNTVANKVLKVYPPSGGAINGGTDDAAITMRAGQSGFFVSLGDSDYAAVYDTDTIA